MFSTAAGSRETSASPALFLPPTSFCLAFNCGGQPTYRCSAATCRTGAAVRRVRSAIPPPDGTLVVSSSFTHQPHHILSYNAALYYTICKNAQFMFHTSPGQLLVLKMWFCLFHNNLLYSSCYSICLIRVSKLTLKLHFTAYAHTHIKKN